MMPAALVAALAVFAFLSAGPAGAQDAEAVLRQTFTTGGTAALEKGNYPEAERLLKAALTEAGKYPKEYIQLNAILEKLGSCYLRQGKLADAEPLYLRLSESCARYKGDSSPAYADSLYNLALLYGRQGKVEQARDSLTRALAIYQQAGAGSTADDLARADCAYGLALINFKRADYSECEANLKTAIGLYDRLCGESSADFTDGISLLSRVYAHDEKYELAEKLGRRALELDESLRGKGDAAVAADHYQLGILAEKQGQLNQAADSLAAGVAIYDQLAAAAKASKKTGKADVATVSANPARQQAERSKAAGADAGSRARSLDKLADMSTVTPYQAMHAYAAVLGKLGRLPEAKRLEARARAAEKVALTGK